MKPVLFTTPDKDVLLRRNYILSLNINPYGHNDKDFGTMWVYCSRHENLHKTGWCSYMNVFKQPLYGKTISEVTRELNNLIRKGGE